MAADNQEIFSGGNQVMEWTHNQSLQRLDMDLTNFLQSQIDQMFEQNPGLRQIKKLSLRNVTSRDVVDRLLDNFTEVEILWLWGSNEIVREFTDDWAFDWISPEWFQTFGKLTNLKNLTLHRYRPRSTEGSPPSIRHFTMLQEYWFMFIDYEQARPQSIEQKQKYKQFVENMAKQFPNLEVLSIMTDIHRLDRYVNLWTECIAEFNHLKQIQSVEFPKYVRPTFTL